VSTRPFTFRHLISLSLIAGIAFLTYSNTFQAPFHFDDWPNILENQSIQVKVFTWDRVEQMVGIIYKETIRILSYFTFALNYYLGGFNVFGYHLVNLTIHIATGVLLYWFLSLTFSLPNLKERYGSLSSEVPLLVSLIFISHPIQTQSVTYIVQRMTSMAGMFYLLSLILYVKGRLTPHWSRIFYFGGTVLGYLLGVFSKENGAILPLFIVLYEFYFFQNLKVSSKGRKVLLILIGSIFLLVLVGLVLWGERYLIAIEEGYRIRDFTLGERVLTQFRVVLYYLTLLLYPHPSRLNLDYDFPISRGILNPPTTLISILIVAGLIGYAIWTAKKRPVLSFCILWYFGNLAIESSIFPLEMVFEHRLYIPAIGPIVLFSLFLIEGFTKLKKRFIRNQILFDRLKTFAIFSIIFLLFLGTYERNTFWKSDIKLLEDCIKKSPNKIRIRYNLGLAYQRAGLYQEAVESYQRAIELKGKENKINRAGTYFESMDASLYNNLGVVYRKLERYEDAIKSYLQAIRIKPSDPDSFNNLGLAYYAVNKLREAVDAFRQAIFLKPDDDEFYYNLGVTFNKLNIHRDAVKAYMEAIRINEGNVKAHFNLGVSYSLLGERNLATDQYKILRNLDKERAHKLLALINNTTPPSP
jgi:tetratricopeptide (TPR) repeat protein